jgi:uncharacterized phiE125 gp8 family phage protein
MLTSHYLITHPPMEPVTIDAARQHCRIDGTADDVLVGALIVAARQHVEAVTGRALVTQTWELRIPHFEERIELPKAPVISVTSVTYIDPAGATQTLDASNYQLLAGGGSFAQPPALVEAYDRTWPSTRGHHEDVRIRYSAGYGAPSAVPAGLRQVMLLLIAHLYENREATAPVALQALPLGVTALVSPYVVFG